MLYVSFLYLKVRCACGKYAPKDQIVRNCDEFLDLFQCEYPLGADLSIFRIVSSVNSLPESVRFYFQNFTYITGHVKIFLFESKVVHKRIWVSQIRWIYGNSKEWQVVR